MFSWLTPTPPPSPPSTPPPPPLPPPPPSPPLAMRGDRECCTTLKACYDAMSGPEWKSSTGAKVGQTWLDPNIKCCDKEWISCKSGLIDEIKFKFIPKLKGTIPPQLALLRDLQELDVRNCDLSGTLPDTLFSSDSVFEEEPHFPSRPPLPSPSPPPPPRELTLTCSACARADRHLADRHHGDASPHPLRLRHPQEVRGIPRRHLGHHPSHHRDGKGAQGGSSRLSPRRTAATASDPRAAAAPPPLPPRTHPSPSPPPRARALPPPPAHTPVFAAVAQWHHPYHDARHR